MKFLYEYQDKFNKRHSGALNASDRAAAYAALKERGIKPIRCELAPGLVNLVIGKGKRWLAIVILGSLCVVLSVVVGRVVFNASQHSTVDSTFDSPTRRQIIGDSAVIEKGVRTGWADMFALEGERFLASFAIPGVVPAIRSTTEEKLKEALATTNCRLPDSNSLEARQIFAVVAGMKKEITKLLSSGWTLREVGAALVRRQEQEIGYYERAKNEIDIAAKSGMSGVALEQLLDRRNDSLRKLGIRLVLMPEEGDEKK